MSKTIEHFFKPVGGNDSSSSKAVHAAAVLAAQKETEQAFAKIKTRKFCSSGNSRNFRIANISTHTVTVWGAVGSDAGELLYSGTQFTGGKQEVGGCKTGRLKVQYSERTRIPQNHTLSYIITDLYVQY